ncbi:MAG: bifunctional (p)ppGpp synthetase/guanosine-3',5'-bis(diphosphate) 3'-pyrophosphohydrolase [Spirochaetota bacterium]|nr:bifunctional (p)ppGpp synthetase/guanosine-3',5'-bis(diphosphate) 3'-pyrophosphohydrolase [Spirochaetota bacterium]
MPEIEFKIRSRDIDTLVDIVTQYCTQIEIEQLSKAYEYAENAHKCQFRLSGEPFIIHPLEVAIILANLNLDITTIKAALLHDVVEDTETSLEFIKEKFGEDTSLLVDGVTKISSIKKRTRYDEQALNLRKMLLSTIKDVRVIIIKLADKLHNMRTIMFQPEVKQKQIAKEVLDIYAPMAGRLGISKIRSELEDIAFRVLYAEEYNKISREVVQKKQEIVIYIKNIENTLQDKLNENNIKAVITGRAKHYYSIFRKMQLQKRPLDDIFDIRAIRIITDEIKDCYAILGIIHTIWPPIGSRFKDYIAVPKSNMYRSIHTTVIGPEGHALEIQIRTWEMHSTAEMGIAAHWLYKEDSNVSENEFINLALLKNINKWPAELNDTREFMKELKMDLYDDEIFVFTPKGKIINLAKGSTAIDFAYAIHTEIGNHCIGAKVNNTIVPLRSEIKSGDIIEILTSKKGHPSQTWLKYVKSSNARYKIRSWLRNQENNQKVTEPDEPSNKDEKIAEVTIPKDELLRIKDFPKRKILGISVDGTSNIQIKLSQCCQPIPGDEVIGFITRGRGITAHKKDCSSLKRLSIEKERLINIIWESSENIYPVKIAVFAIDRPNLLKDIVSEISLHNTNMLKVEAQVKEKDNAIFKFVLQVRNVDHLKEIISRIKKIKSVSKVHKINEKVLIK